MLQNKLTGKPTGTYTMKYIKKKIKENVKTVKRLKTYKKHEKRSKKGNKEELDYGCSNISYISLLELEEKMHEFLKKLDKTQSEINDLEKATIEQNCALWYAERRMRLTASWHGAINKMREDTNCENNVINILYKPFKGNTATKYGKSNEDVATKTVA
ncbi:unnamed protein product [Psylliodes chrysocephalus]|uniref:Uncharacterized protein n=1 Tax=Psylliodes chrysocephalus TaxID=3402493 RepID=A0A9P0GN23_9CUCU|nr:unnamed protein product [Psylliodes chrysocephala]